MDKYYLQVLNTCPARVLTVISKLESEKLCIPKMIIVKKLMVLRVHTKAGWDKKKKKKKLRKNGRFNELHQMLYMSQHISRTFYQCKNYIIYVVFMNCFVLCFSFLLYFQLYILQTLFLLNSPKHSISDENKSKSYN